MCSLQCRFRLSALPRLQGGALLRTAAMVMPLLKSYASAAAGKLGLRMVCARINQHTSATISASDREPRTGWNRLTGIISLAAASSLGQRASTSQPSKPARNQAQSQDLKGPPLLCKRCAYERPPCRSNPRPQGPGSRALPTELWEWPMGGGLCSSVA